MRIVVPGHGALRITGGTEETLTLEAEDGTDVTFDLASETLK